jgi:hypothetical protein
MTDATRPEKVTLVIVQVFQSSGMYAKRKIIGTFSHCL